MSKKNPTNYFCIGVRRDYEDIWRMVSKHATRDEAEIELEKRRGYTGAFNYDNAELKIFSRAEGKAEFGEAWEYKPIGTPEKPPAKTSKKVQATS